MKTIKIENVGPIEHFEIRIPEKGGVLVLNGANGKGKTTALNAASSFMAGGGCLSKRDGAAEARVSGLGTAQLTFKKSLRFSGQLEVESLSGKLSIADLVDPGIQDPERADAARIKALVQLTGTLASADRFAAIMPEDAGDFAKLIDGIPCDDAVAFAAAVKRRVAALARDAEAAAEKSAGTASGFRQSAGNVDGNECPVNPDVFQSALEAAVRRETTLKADRENGLKAAREAVTARKDLATVRESYKGPSVAEARASLEAKVTEAAIAQSALDAARERLEAAKALLHDAGADVKAADAHDFCVRTWQKTIDAADGAAFPPEAEIDKAALAVAEARKNIERAALRRKAAADARKADAWETDAKANRDRANRLRDASAKTDDVLSGIVATLNSPLRVKNGRLVLTTDRGEELLGDLSTGERWRVAFGIAAPLVPENGVLVIPQEAWSELDPRNRAEVDGLAREHRVCVLTAEASDGPLASAAFNGHAVDLQEALDRR